MSYVVQAQNGDTLCSVARRHGYSNCGTLRSQQANAGLLDRPLVLGDNVTIPQAWNGWVYPSIAMGRRWTVRWAWPVAVPPQATVRIVRKAAAAPTAVNVLANIGISRFVTRSVTANGANDWCDHNQHDFDAGSNGDPCTFSIEVNDASAAGPNVTVLLEALQPTYSPLRAVTGHQRFAAGAVRNARSLSVTTRHLGALPPGRFWSSELRLVTHRLDKQLRPQQTLLVTDLFADDGTGTDIEILDQNIRATYEDANCPRAVGERCIKARHEIPLRRGQSVAIEGFVVRGVADGTNNDNGLVNRQDLINRVRVHCKRIYAQEELTFTINAVTTVDPPSDMLTVSEPDGANATGTNAGGVVQGQVGFTLTYTPFHGLAVVHNLGPFAIPAHNTPMQTANTLVTALNLLANIQAQASQNAPENGAAAGSVDIVITANNGTAAISNLTAANLQDQTQPVERVQFDVNAVDDEQPASSLRKGGPPMRRQLFKSQATAPDRISIFVVREARGGLTTSSLHYLSARGLGVDAAVRNCLTMKYQNVDGELTERIPTLPHEIGHALTDADHVDFNVDNQSLMHPGQTITHQWYDTRRISGPGNAAHRYQLVGDNTHRLLVGGIWPNGAPAVGHLDLIEYNTTMHDLIAANGSLTFTAR
ncbi:hypothetical protein JY651_27690 [Pyxidicoccus parkwayensis]|uniref:LysM domain-containing protein n=1 Tax=Pyxidicoccus parkwayensis TaxID=2813578 RepID=A0ABX7NK26_9BACT|nr:hypothetical protein [Pyxidicoccus parkwaysis]QSQ19130.1 hypothetical protein JY651_27690 [Pyxidicoccus parkwaysis]